MNSSIGAVPIVRAVAACAVLAVLLCHPAASAGQGEPPPLGPDRPDQTESPYVLPRGLAQFESGFVWSPGALTASESTLRIGLLKPLELRLGFLGWQRLSPKSGTGGTESGVGDLELGAKYQFAQGSGRRPAAGVVAAVTLPTGAEGFGAERSEPTIRLALDWELRPWLSLGASGGPTWITVSEPGDTRRTEAEVFYSAVLGADLSDRVGVFVEVFSTVPTGDGGAAYSVDGGFTVQVLGNFQLDVSGGRGLNDAAEDWFMGTGVTVRMPR